MKLFSLQCTGRNERLLQHAKVGTWVVLGHATFVHDKHLSLLPGKIGTPGQVLVERLGGCSAGKRTKKCVPFLNSALGLKAKRV